MPAVGRNAPCPCGSGRKRKRCHPEGLDAPRWSLADPRSGAGAGAPSGPPSRVVVVRPSARSGAEEEGKGWGEEEEEGEQDGGEVVGEEGADRDEPDGDDEETGPGPDGLRLTREILDADLGPGDFTALAAALNAKIKAHRALETARAQALLRVGMRARYRGRKGPMEGTVSEIRRTRVIMCVDGKHWSVPASLVRPLEEGAGGGTGGSV